MKKTLRLACSLACALFLFASGAALAQTGSNLQSCYDKCSFEQHRCSAKCTGKSFRPCSQACDDALASCREDCDAGKPAKAGPCATAAGGRASPAWGLLAGIGGALALRRRRAAA